MLSSFSRDPPSFGCHLPRRSQRPSATSNPMFVTASDAYSRDLPPPPVLRSLPSPAFPLRASHTEM
ncbi:hypothetical protein Lser_V15G31752 [Lactuca serriola]